MRKDILGPRGGAHEVFSAGAEEDLPDPSREYVTGVLEPRDFKRGALEFFDRNTAAASQDISRMEGEDGERDTSDEDCDCSFGIRELSSSLDPRALPKSIGLSLVLKDENEPFSFCATWARYTRKGLEWVRCPFYTIVDNVTPGSNKSWSPEEDRGVEIRLRSHRLDKGVYVSLYLINITDVSGKTKLTSEDMIFQPQLRLSCQNNNSLLPVRGSFRKGEETEGMAFLYRERTEKARGHLCGAVWYEVDPEREHPSSPSGTEPGAYEWVDGKIIPPDQRQRFIRPHARTEFLPLYTIEQAKFTGPVDHKIAPIPSQDLSDAWDVKKLDSLLNPLIDGYAGWIDAQREKAFGLDQYAERAGENIRLCEKTLQRMKEGMELLKTDQDARLAFCFMNRAMYLQSVWKSKSPLRWHPFQIAFILQCIRGIVEEDGAQRLICDLLWFPTGAGKTEAYLGLTAFTLAYNRRKAIKTGNLWKQAGVNVLSRYTLRLLTIQQFRRTLNIITACEFLRCTNWAPADYPAREGLFGTVRFSIGIWVGESITPNRLEDLEGYDPKRNLKIVYPGAISELYGRERLKGGRQRVEGEISDPAQVLKCPACDSILAVTQRTLVPGRHILHWVVSAGRMPDVSLLPRSPYKGINVLKARITPLRRTFFVLSIELDIATGAEIRPETIDGYWDDVVQKTLGAGLDIQSARPSRPGYFLWHSPRLSGRAVDFEIHCPNPDCELNSVQWSEAVPVKDGLISGRPLPPFAANEERTVSSSMPIPAYTVDEQIYNRCPSVVVATVDKFARLAYEPKAAQIFGNVTHYDEEYGFFREGVLSNTDHRKVGDSHIAGRLDPPSLIIQDELHLIDGPLGSMVGLYETGIELLASKTINGKTILPKYISSTATIRRASYQVQALFGRQLSQFPPPGISIDDNFFAVTEEPHPGKSSPPGRLYVGVCAPGRGAHTPIVRIWSALMQTMQAERVRRSSSGTLDGEFDNFWTVVGYFNSKRELAGALGLFRQDIPSRIGVLSKRAAQPPRIPSEWIELSSRTESIEVPSLLDRLSKPNSDVDAVFATSMFGTGIDVDRLGLMIVHGQPKTTANYIQATGRVGRRMGGLIVTFLRASRPRDLNHYEFFTGYHRNLHRYVEPVTVYPFSPKARDTGMGPLCVAILRNSDRIDPVGNMGQRFVDDRKTGSSAWASDARTVAQRRNSPEVEELIDSVIRRSSVQPKGQKPPTEVVRKEISSELDRWEGFAKRYENLVYWESTMAREPKNHVVLGDPAHELKGLMQVYENAPQSLRTVEDTVTFDDEG